MKRGKDDDKIMGPMFPRLHVNDTDKGGPRAPPRNKMALYEQLSIPSQRFSHVVLPCNLNNGSPNLVPPSSQSGGNDEGMFFPRQVHPRYPSEKQYSQFSELSSPLAQVEQRKKSDEDDYRVPIFIHSVPTEFDKYSNCINREKISSLNPPSKFQKPNRTRVLEQSTRQEGENKNGENSNKAVAAWNQTVSSLGHETGDDLDNSTDGLRADDSGQPEVCAESQVSSDTAKRDSSSSEKALPSEDENIVYDLSDDTGSREDGPSEDGSCRPLQTENLERADSVSEASILDAALGPDITPDDVVGIIGQKQFWKARRAIANQQRVFAIQVFELHRLIKVQKLFAASPHLLLEDTAYFGKPIKPLSGKKRSLDDAVKTNSNAPKRKSDTENESHRKEFSAENTVEKASLSSGQNGVLPSSCRPSAVIPPAPATTGVDHNTRTPCFSHQQQAHQWLVPVMSPTEGLIYKAYSGTGFVGQACGGCGPPTSNPMIGNFLAPAYGIPAPPHQYPFPSFPPFGPHGYYPPYGMPIMNTAAFSGSSIEQMNPTPTPGHSSAKEAMSTVPTQENEAVPDGLNSRPDEEIEVQASTSSSPNEREPGNWASRAAEGKNMLPLFPTSPAITASKVSSQLVAPDGPIRVIKVVPRNGISASESAARIFQSIQEERKQYDSA